MRLRGALLASGRIPFGSACDPVPFVGRSGSPVTAVVPPPRASYTPREMRQMMISEFSDWLRTQTNKQHRLFQAETILAYRNAAVALSAWMNEVSLEVDFTGCDTDVLTGSSARFMSPTARAAPTPSNATFATRSPG